MALSMYFNWDSSTLQTMNNPEMMSSNFHEAVPELSPDYLAYCSDNESFFFPNTFFDSYPELIYPHDLLSSTSASPYHDPALTSLSDIFPLTEDDDHNNDLLLPCPKRQKHSFETHQVQDQYYYPVLDNYNFLDGFVPNHQYYPPCSSLLSLPLPLPFPLVGDNSGDGDNYEKKSSGSGSEKTRAVSAQSIAARERRRKITEKTQELGKLVPGGSKMNTADMLHAASNYVKFLQAQRGMLQLMNSLQEEDKGSTPSEDLQLLLASTSVQEKLYLEDKCFVPTDLVTTLTNHSELQSRPSILQDLNQFIIGTDTEKKPQQQ